MELRINRVRIKRSRPVKRLAKWNWYWYVELNWRYVEYWPTNGTATDVAGTDSATISENTLSDSKMVIPESDNKIMVLFLSWNLNLLWLGRLRTGLRLSSLYRGKVSNCFACPKDLSMVSTFRYFYGSRILLKVHSHEKKVKAQHFIDV